MHPLYARSTRVKLNQENKKRNIGRMQNCPISFNTDTTSRMLKVLFVVKLQSTRDLLYTRVELTMRCLPNISLGV